MNDQIQQKLYHFETSPPAPVWSRIAAALEDEELQLTKTKLENFQQTPPAGAWDKIASRLSPAAHQVATVLPFHRRFAKPIRYSAAAAIIAVIVLTGALLTNQRSASEGLPSTVASQNGKGQTPPVKSSPSSNVLSSLSLGKQVVSPRTSITQRAITAVDVRREFERVRPIALSISSAIERIIPQTARRNGTMSFGASDRYMAYAVGDGSAVRLPRKMYDAVTCPNEDLACLQRLRQVQERMASSALTADFTGVLDILNNLGENQ